MNSSNNVWAAHGTIIKDTDSIKNICWLQVCKLNISGITNTLIRINGNNYSISAAEFPYILLSDDTSSYELNGKYILYASNTMCMIFKNENPDK